MKRIALALALLVAVPAIADARCQHYNYRRHTSPKVDGFCKGVQNAEAKSQVNDEDFIAGFPSREQPQVKRCLELAK
jgi:hypothetical protein